MSLFLLIVVVYVYTAGTLAYEMATPPGDRPKYWWARWTFDVLKGVIP